MYFEHHGLLLLYFYTSKNKYFLIVMGNFYTLYLINRQIINFEVAPDTDKGTKILNRYGSA